MRHQHKVFILLALTATWCCRFSLAEENDGFHIRAHRKLYSYQAMSTRARGLGHSYAALSNGAMGVVENPAGLGAQIDHQLLMELGLDQVDEGGDTADIISVNVGGAININHTAPHYWPRDNMGNHTFGIIIHHDGLNYDEADGLYGGMTGATFAYGRSFMDGEYFGGASFTYAEGDFSDDNLRWDQGLKRWEWKIGGIARPLEELALGATFSYGRGSINDEGSLYNDNGEIRHFELRVGAAYMFTDTVTLVGDLAREDLDTIYQEHNVWEEHEIWTFSGGLERIMIPDTLTLRGGMYFTTDSYNSKGVETGSQNDDYMGLTGGASFFKDNFELAYTLDLRTTGEVGNYFTVEFDW